MYCVNIPRAPYADMKNACLIAFNFPYRHSENAELGELRMLGAGFGQDNFTDPMESQDVERLIRGS